MNKEERDKETNDTILKDYLDWIELNDIVCPYPDMWMKIWDKIIQLTNINNHDLIDLINRPCVLNSWDNPEHIKRERFINHLKFAHEKNVMFWINREIEEYQLLIETTNANKKNNSEWVHHDNAFLQMWSPKNTKKKKRLEWQQGVMKPNNYYKMTNPFPNGSPYN